MRALNIIKRFLSHRIILSFLIVAPVYLFLYKIYMPKVNAFGCFDDCFNIVPGYFITRGKVLYSEIFFNHQALPPYISAFIQTMTRPINIYDLFLRHRQFLLLFGFVMNILLVYRFSLTGVGFMLLYEFSKFYIFGDRFLAESFIVYPLVYMTGLVWEKIQKKKILRYEYILSALFAWFVVFMREPFIFVPLFLFSLLLLGKQSLKIKLISVVVFIVLTISIFFVVPFHDFIWNVFSQNFFNTFGRGVEKSSIGQDGYLKIFFYPVFLFFGGEWGLFRYFLIGLCALWIALLLYVGIYKKNWKLFLFIFFTQSLANIRVYYPFKPFYSAFHIIPWYALFIFSLFLLLTKVKTYSIKLFVSIILVVIVFFGYLTLSPDSYIYDRIDPQYEFITNFGKELQVGEVFRALSNPSDTLFLDGFDDLIYWQAQRESGYKYSWYTAYMANVPEYKEARISMFTNSPPNFYYGSCPKEIRVSHLLPKEVENDYIRLTSQGNPTCVFVHKEKLPLIRPAQWKRANEFMFELPVKKSLDFSLNL